MDLCKKTVFPGYAHLAGYVCQLEAEHEGDCDHRMKCPTCGSRSKTDIGACSPCLFRRLDERR